MSPLFFAINEGFILCVICPLRAFIERSVRFGDVHNGHRAESFLTVEIRFLPVSYYIMLFFENKSFIYCT